MRRKRGSSSSFYLCNDPMSVWIWCSQLCPIFATLHSNNKQTFWEPSRTFCRIPTKTIFCSNGLMGSFCQNSCWWSRIVIVNHGTQTVGGTKGFSFKPTPVTNYYFPFQKHNSALRNDPLYQFQQLAGCPEVSNHKGCMNGSVQWPWVMTIEFVCLPADQ